MKTLATMAVVAMALAAQAATDGQKAAASDEVRAARREKMMQATGGILTVAAKGKVVVVNAQERIPRDVVAEVVERLATELKMNVEMAESPQYEMYVRPKGATGAIVVADRDDLPMSVVAAERTWGLVNVDKFGDGDRAARRFRREFSRVACFALGQSHSQFMGSPLATVKSVEDLDGIVTESMTFDAQMMVLKTRANLGMTQSRKTSYKKACQEGWAPAPTNEYQKAIWDKVHEMPTEPIKIKPETKKVQQ